MNINKLNETQAPLRIQSQGLVSAELDCSQKIQKIITHVLSHIALLPVHIGIALVKGPLHLMKVIKEAQLKVDPPKDPDAVKTPPKEEEPTVISEEPTVISEEPTVISEEPTEEPTVEEPTDPPAPDVDALVQEMIDSELKNGLKEALLEDNTENRSRFYEQIQKIASLKVKLFLNPELKNDPEHVNHLDAAKASYSLAVQAAKMETLTALKLEELFKDEQIEDSPRNRNLFQELIQRVVSLEIQSKSGAALEEAKNSLSCAVQAAKIDFLTSQELPKWLKKAYRSDTPQNRSRFYDKVKRVVQLKKEKIDSPHLEKDKNHRLARKVAKGVLSVSLDPRCLKPIGVGVHGSAWVNSLSGKHLGVFKPNPKDLDEEDFLRMYFSQSSYLNPGEAAEAASERASFILAQALNLDQVNVAAVELMELEGEKGAFLTFEKGEMAQDYVLNMEFKASYSEKELNIFQSFAIFDYLIGNLDRKDDNWLVVWENNQLQQITPIDNANSFPIAIPENWNGKSIHRWKDLAISKMPFTKSMVQFIEENITSESVERIIQLIDNDPQIQSFYPSGKRFLSPESRYGIRDRFNRLRNLIQTVNNPSPAMMELTEKGYPILDAFYQTRLFFKKLYHAM